MARSLTKAQITRRLAILTRLRQVPIATLAELRQYLASRRHIYVTEDTVGRDLRAMKDVGTVKSSPHPTVGHEWGGGRRIRHTGWTLAPDARKNEAL